MPIYIDLSIHDENSFIIIAQNNGDIVIDEGFENFIEKLSYVTGETVEEIYDHFKNGESFQMDDD